MIGQLVYIVMETTDVDATVMSVHTTEETARAKRDKLQGSYPRCRYWVDILRVKN